MGSMMFLIWSQPGVFPAKTPRRSVTKDHGSDIACTLRLVCVDDVPSEVAGLGVITATILFPSEASYNEFQEHGKRARTCNIGCND